MTLPQACCTLKPVESSYTPKGKDTKLGDLVIYETGDSLSPNLLICLYDIFGVHPVTQQVCDKLGDAGWRVIMPDFFRGKPFPQENFPPKDRQIIMDFVSTTGSWDKVVRQDMVQLFQHYQSQGVKKIGTFGFCWGSKMGVQVAKEFATETSAAVLIHPAFVAPEEGDKVLTPVLSLPTKDDDDMVAFNEKVKARFGEDGSGHHRFEDIHHGFCSARGDLENELNRKRVDEALALTNAFFKRHMK